MSSNQNQGYLPHDGPVQRSNAYYQNDNAFTGFDSAMSGHAGESWEFEAERLNLAHNHDPTASLYPDWQASKHHSLPSTSAENHNAFYEKSHANNAALLQSAQFRKTVGAFNHGVAAPDYSSSYPEPSRTAGFHFGDHGPTNIPTKTIAPGALQSHNSSYVSSQNANPPQSTSTARNAITQQVPRSLPKGVASGKFSVITPESLGLAFRCRRLHHFVHVADEAQDVWSTKTTIPAYIPRKSRNEIQKLLANDSGITAKLAKKHPKKSDRQPMNQHTELKGGAVALPRREIVKQEDSASASEPEYSDDDTSEDESEEESMQAPLPASRPTKPIEAVKYDTIKALWRVPYRSATSDDIRNGLAEFGEIVRTIRDRWRTDTQAAKEAEEAKKVNELPLLQDRVLTQRELLEATLQVAVNEGHKDIVEHLAENTQLVVALTQFLQDRAQSSDFSGGLTKVILQVLSRCKTLTDGNLEKYRIAKLLPRFTKRGDETTRSLSKRITDNAVNATKKRNITTRPGVGVASQAKDTKSTSTTEPTAESPISGLKRPRVNDGTADLPSKRVAADSASTGPLRTAAIPKRASTESDTKPQITAAGAAATKKATQVVAKPSSFFSNNFSGLQSAKRPATAAAVKAPTTVAKPAVPASAKPTMIAAAPKAATPAPRPTFSIADTLASVVQPRVVEPVKTREASGPPESAEERAKRLRKEERRKLRVSFKPEKLLVEIRYLSPQAEEELSRNAFEVRDAGDIDSEGRMFKLKSHEDPMDLDEEDEEPSPLDDLSRPYNAPSLIDFSTVLQDERERMYVPYGGGVVEPECPERLIQEQREANTLIAVYAHPSDIPPTPKEPTEAVEETGPLKAFGAVPDYVEFRLESIQNAQKAAVSTASAITAVDLAALLNSMPNLNPVQQLQGQQASQVQSQPGAQQQAQTQVTATALEHIFAQFAQPSQQSQATSAQPLSQYQQQHPQMPQFSGMPGMFGTPNPAATFQQPSPAPNLPGDISAILATLQQSGHVPNLVGGATPGFNQYQQQQDYGQQQQQGYPPNYGQQQQYGFENAERRRIIEAGDRDGDDERGEKSRGNKGRKDPGRPTPKFVVQCKYWKEGKCRKGADCTFLHTA